MGASYQWLALCLMLVQLSHGKGFVPPPKLSFLTMKTGSPVQRHESAADSQSQNTRVAFVLPSFPEDPIIQESADEIAARLQQFCGASVVTCGTHEADGACSSSDVLIALGVESPYDVRFVATAFRLRRTAGRKGTCQFAFGGKPFAPLLDAYDEANPTWQQDISWTAAGKDRKLLLKMLELFEKENAEDYVEAIRLYLGQKGK